MKELASLINTEEFFHGIFYGHGGHNELNGKLIDYFTIY